MPAKISIVFLPLITVTRNDAGGNRVAEEERSPVILMSLVVDLPNNGMEYLTAMAWEAKTAVPLFTPGHCIPGSVQSGVPAIPRL